MTDVGLPSNAKQISAFVRQGEGPSLEFKRSTGELKEGMQTLCAFLNGSGGTVLFGVRADGTIEGQAVSDQTLRDVAQAAERFEPPAHVSIRRVKVKSGREVVAAAVEAGLDMRPFGGAEITGEIVDNRQEHMNAFAMAREGMAFLERTMPLGARFPEGKIFREDRFPIPLDALREILLNAVMHRDYSHYSGYVAVVVFDDRIEIRSYGRLPTGITVEQLSREHASKLVNPLIAGAFHRTGAVEVWSRGTNRVISMCRKHGAAPPVFEERSGFLIVTFKAQIVTGSIPATSKAEHQVGTKSAPSRHQVPVLEYCRSERTLLELLKVAGRSDRTKFRDGVVRPLIEAGLLAMTIPDKPRSRLQRYRTTEAGLAMIDDKTDRQNSVKSGNSHA